MGFLFAALAFICYLFYHHMVKEYLFQTISFPGEIRNPLKNAFSLVKVYLIHKTSWFMYLPLIALVLPARYKRIAFTILVLLVYFLVPFALYRSAPMTHYAFVWPFIIVLASIGIYKNIKDQNVEKHYLVSPTSPIIMIIVANASFLSQGFVGSSYGIWPVFAILISYCYKNFEEMRTGLAIIIAILTFTLALNSINDSRLSFVDTKGPHTMAESSLLSGLGTNGSWFNDLNEIEQYINTNIPENESIYFIPGEDPLYYLTGRTPKLNYFQLNSITLSRDLDSVYADINMAGIKWVIIKTKLQCERGFINYDLLADSIKNNYVLYRKLDSYEIYRLDGLTEH
ncbi:MAG: hypothetical protein HQ521_13140 [Bacteroidetes bacterium]|nr:hypothetical protein [Bacteroidota bacterium]